MKKVILFLVVGIGALCTLSSCLQNEEPAGVENLRNAKSELIKAEAQYKAAEIADGISLMMLNNDKGSELFHLAKDYMTFEERDFNEALERNKPMIVPSNRPLARETFYQDLRSHGYGQVAKSYFKQGNKTRCVSWLRENAPRSVVVGIRNALQTLIWKRNGSKALPK